MIKPRNALALALFLGACATVGKPDIELLKPTVEAFHKGIRWKDFRASAELIVPERRGSFLKARSKINDDRDLTISDFSQDDATVAPDLQSATVVSKMSWFRLPNNSEQTATVTSVFVWRQSQWMLESQDDGPFAELKPAPESVPAPPPKAVEPARP